ncbi:rubrerythrin [Caldicoprobacter guelmensis]|uniref:ferritin family protein n=1 Tax=Caldicoprobacter guelmensis TaxID=1170224 RepID=UPI00195738F4|nr:ferritin family protein [Caldicoprobacter guelmensis]MBM7582385.1 rubrerythrin [Caldicoprobacter guelmensis]
MEKIKKILKFAMRMEKNARDFYEFYADKDVSAETKRIFEELIEIEKQHFDALKKEYDKAGFKEAPLDISWVVDENFKARDPHILADNSDMLKEADAGVSDVSVMRMAYLIETDFWYFYDKAAKAVDEPEVKKLLTDLAEWEKQHSDMFYKKYLELLDKNLRDIKIILE